MVTVSDVVSDPHCQLTSIWCPQPMTPVRWVASSDLPDPTPFLEGGEILLTTASKAVDWGEEEWFAYMENLASHDVAALGIAVEIILDALPQQAIRAAKRCGLNIFEVPKPIPFVQITRHVATMISDEQQAGQRLLLAAQHDLIEAAQNYDPVDASLEVLGRHLGIPCALIRSSGRIMSRSHSHLPFAEASGQSVTRGCKGLVPRLKHQSMISDGYLWAFRCEGLVGGHGALVCHSELPLSVWQTDLLHSSSLLLSVLLNAQSQVHGNRRAVLHRSVECALSGDMRSARLLASTVFPESRRLQGTLHAAAVQAVDPGDQSGYDQVADNLLGLVNMHTPPLFAGVIDDQLIVIFAHSALPLIRSRLESLCAEEGLLCGIGTHVAPQFLGQSLNSARAALRAASASQEVVTWQDIHSGGLLHVIGYERSQAVSDDVRRRINDPQLWQTLEAFIHANGQRAQVAASLGVHRNTVHARIDKIQHLLGLNIDDPGVRAYLWVAMAGNSR